MLIRRTAIGLILALLVALPVMAQTEEPKPRTVWDSIDLMFGEAAYDKGDYVKAARQFRIAAEKYNSWSDVAMFRLGLLYVKGQGVPQDYAEAVKWFRRAANRRNAAAQLALGNAYGRSLGVTQDNAEAVKWFRKAAEQGHAQAQLYLGIRYASGEGVPQDYVLAHMWYSLSAAIGHQDGAKARAAIATLMTPAQIAEAQKLAREWWAKHPNKK